MTTPVADARISRFIISLDLELHWGVFDKRDLGAYRANLNGVYEAVPRMLDLFAEFGTHATWATVGLLACNNADDALMFAPLPELRPTYRNARLNPYRLFDEMRSENERYYFAPSLVRQILDTPGQELATHTFCHLYTMEDGITPEAIRADLHATKAIFQRFQCQPSAVVFPRNQYTHEALAVYADEGIQSYRGQPLSALYQPTPDDRQNLLIRGARLVDHYLPLTNRPQPPTESGINGLINIPATSFLRPHSPKLAALAPLQLRRILAELREATRTGADYHLWWHPHNFGVHLDENLQILRSILTHARYLHDQGTLEFSTMTERAQTLP